MNHSQLISTLSEKTGLRKTEITSVIDALTAIVPKTLLASDDVRIVGLGIFKVQDGPAHIGRKPGNRRADPDRRIAQAEVHAGQGIEGRDQSHDRRRPKGGA